MHMTLTKAGKAYRRNADITYVITVILAILSSFLSVLMGASHDKNDDGSMGELMIPDKSNSRIAIEQILIVVPLVTSAMGAFNSLTRYLQKWGVVTTAAGQIVREIYQFRTHVIEYNPISGDSENKVDGEEEENAANEKAPRKVFVKKVQSIFRTTLETLGNDALEEAWSGHKMFDEDDSQSFKQKLRAYVPRNVLKAGPYYAKGGDVRTIEAKNGICSCAICRRRKSKEETAKKHGCGWLCKRKRKEKVLTFDDLEDMPADDSLLFAIEADDYVSPMQIETFVEYRLRVKLALLQKHALVLSKWLMRLETAVILVTAFGTLLAGFGLHAWIALTVSIAGAFANLTQYKCLQSRLSATNAAITDLRTVMIAMDSLSIVEKRTPVKKTFCVAIVEGAIFNTITAWTGVGVSAQDDGKGDGESKKEE
jgi:hypothetical protein